MFSKNYLELWLDSGFWIISESVLRIFMILYMAFGFYKGSKLIEFDFKKYRSLSPEVDLMVHYIKVVSPSSVSRGAQSSFG